MALKTKFLHSMTFQVFHDLYEPCLKPEETVDILRHHNWFPCKIMFEEEQRNSILMMVTTHIWAVVQVGHQYGISAVVPQVSFHGDHISDDIAKCWLFLRLTLLLVLHLQGHSILGFHAVQCSFYFEFSSV